MNKVKTISLFNNYSKEHVRDDTKAILRVALDFNARPTHSFIGSFHDKGVTTSSVLCFYWLLILSIIRYLSPLNILIVIKNEPNEAVFNASY